METIAHTAQSPPIREISFASAIGRVIDRLFAWINTARQRRTLAELDERMLKDVGLTRADVEREIEKPFWRYY